MSLPFPAALQNWCFRQRFACTHQEQQPTGRWGCVKSRSQVGLGVGGFALCFTISGCLKDCFPFGWDCSLCPQPVPLSTGSGLLRFRFHPFRPLFLLLVAPAMGIRLECVQCLLPDERGYFCPLCLSRQIFLILFPFFPNFLSPLAFYCLFPFTSFCLILLLQYSLMSLSLSPFICWFNFQDSFSMKTTQRTTFNTLTQYKTPF